MRIDFSRSTALLSRNFLDFAGIKSARSLGEGDPSLVRPLHLLSHRPRNQRPIPSPSRLAPTLEHPGAMLARRPSTWQILSIRSSRTYQATHTPAMKIHSPGLPQRTRRRECWFSIIPSFLPFVLPRHHRLRLLWPACHYLGCTARGFHVFTKR